jgi:hypothetical protein
MKPSKQLRQSMSYSKEEVLALEAWLGRTINTPVFDARAPTPVLVAVYRKILRMKQRLDLVPEA